MNDREALDQQEPAPDDDQELNMRAVVLDGLRQHWSRYNGAAASSRKAYEEAQRKADDLHIIMRGHEKAAEELDRYVRALSRADDPTPQEVLDIVTGPVPAPESWPEPGRGQTCPHHVLQQHRDGKPPWCNTCGLTASGQRAEDLQLRRPITGPQPALTDMQVRAHASTSPAAVPFVVQSPQGRQS